jgi:hypothetical protein
LVSHTPSTCLNCDAELHGPFCSRCGQRVIPPYPSVRALAGDAWEEISGWDGRYMRTLRRLFGQPGGLTVDVLEGHRARYVSPVRLYLVASVLYFLVAAATPNLGRPPAAAIPGSSITIDLGNPEATPLSPEQRAEALRRVERAPWFVRPLMRSAISDPAAFRSRVAEYLPRMFFVLVPLFAGILSLFFRRRPLSQHLVLALHLHAAVFVAQAVRQVVNFTGSRVMLAVAAIVVAIFLVWHTLVAMRRVYGEPRAPTALKALGIAVVYAITAFAGMMVTLIWASLA